MLLHELRHAADTTAAVTGASTKELRQQRDVVLDSNLLRFRRTTATVRPVRQLVTRSSFGVHRGQAGFETGTPRSNVATRRNGFEAEELS